MDAKVFKECLVTELAKCEKVLAVGQTGDVNAPLIPGQSDVDLFVLCSAIPTPKERADLYAALADGYENCLMSVCDGGDWGHGDILVCGGVDVMPMYFTLTEMRDTLLQILRGERIEKEGRFYPVGRLASVESLQILFEKNGEWSALKDRVKARPAALMNMIFERRIESVIDEEDLSRALIRKDVLFYHQALENALDHLLQALFALNGVYFPSRKRTREYMERFALKPSDCWEKLLAIIRDASDEETLARSVAQLRELTQETRALKQ